MQDATGHGNCVMGKTIRGKCAEHPMLKLVCNTFHWNVRKLFMYLGSFPSPKVSINGSIKILLVASQDSCQSVEHWKACCPDLGPIKINIMYSYARLRVSLYMQTLEGENFPCFLHADGCNRKTPSRKHVIYNNCTKTPGPGVLSSHAETSRTWD